MTQKGIMISHLFNRKCTLLTSSIVRLKPLALSHTTLNRPFNIMVAGKERETSGTSRSHRWAQNSAGPHTQQHARARTPQQAQQRVYRGTHAHTLKRDLADIFRAERDSRDAERRAEDREKAKLKITPLRAQSQRICNADKRTSI